MQIFEVFSPLDEGALSVIFFMLVCFVGFFCGGGGGWRVGGLSTVRRPPQTNVPPDEIQLFWYLLAGSFSPSLG